MSPRRPGFGRHDRDRLRTAILDGDALAPLIRSDPQRAAERLRAAVLDPLARSRRSLLDDEGSLHITDAPHWLGPVPERGPFLSFLSLAPEIALELFIEIAAQATERWAALARIGDRAYGARIRSWNTMEHRSRALVDLVMRDVLSGEALVDELAAARALWAERDRERLKHLLAQTDLANLQPTELGEGAVMWEYVPPEELRDEVAESNEQLRATQLWLMGPTASAIRSTAAPSSRTGSSTASGRWWRARWPRSCPRTWPWAGCARAPTWSAG
jgi:hypothetical protein